MRIYGLVQQNKVLFGDASHVKKRASLHCWGEIRLVSARWSSFSNQLRAHWLVHQDEEWRQSLYKTNDLY